MNYMKQVAEMLGLEITENENGDWKSEEFNIKLESGQFSMFSPHVITNNGMVDCNNTRSTTTLHYLLKGEYTIEKLPWRPKDGDSYWFYEFKSSGTIIRDWTWDSDRADERVYKYSLLFKSEEEAELHKKEAWEFFKANIDKELEGEE